MSFVGFTVAVVAEPPLGVNETIKFADKNPVPVNVKFVAVVVILFPAILHNVGGTW